MNKKLLRLAPKVLCILLSPATTKDQAETQLKELIALPQLLDLVIECANRHMLAATLYSCLTKHQLIDYLPSILKDYLSYQHNFILNRNLNIKQQYKNITKVFNERNITPLALKGGDTLLYNLYPDYGCRFMSDLDILIPEDKLDLAKDLLIKVGYDIPTQYQGLKENPESHHLTPIYKEGEPCAIELHRQPLNYKCKNIISASEAFESAHYRSFNTLTLNANYKIIHCFIHSEISHGYHKKNYLSLRQMDYFVRLLYFYQKNIDWLFIKNKLSNFGYLDDFLFYCYIADKLFTLPENFLRATQINNHHNSKKLLNRYYSSLDSTLITHHPLKRLTYGFLNLSNIYNRSNLENAYQIENNIDYFMAVSKKTITIFGRFMKNPANTTKQFYKLWWHI